jgi:hypothetical protein
MPVAAPIARNAAQTLVAMQNSGKLQRFQLVQDRSQRPDITASSCAVLQKSALDRHFSIGTPRQ